MRLTGPILSLALLAAVVVVAADGGESPAVASGEQPASVIRSTATGPCQSDPHAGVHEPDRLVILNPCTTFEGTVVRASTLNPSDSDVTVNAQPDPAFASMLNDQNRAEGGLHLEIVPRDQPGCTPGQPITGKVGNLGVCSGANVIFPPLGAHIRVTGPWVFDSWTGWNEIHPVWQVEIIPAAGPAPPEKHIYKAQLTGRPHFLQGAPKASGIVTLTATGTKLCWAFEVLRQVGTPTRADIRRVGTPMSSLRLIALGSRYVAKACATVASSKLKLLEAAPRRYYVAVYTVRYPLGAVRGQLHHASD